MVDNLKKVNWEKVKEELLDVLFPRFCIKCGREGTYLCNDCYTFLSENSLICPVCGAPSFTGTSCDSCIGRYGLDGLTAGWDYEGLMKRTVWEIKAGYYHIGKKMIERFLILMIDQEERFGDFLKFLLKEETKITYVPPTNRKEGFLNKKLNISFKSYGGSKPENMHAKTLAEQTAKLTGKSEKSVTDLLKKTKRTKKQARLSQKERLENVKNAFSVKNNPPKNLVLVDDVFTTGATMRECCKVLKKAGAENVRGLVLARST